MLNFRQELSLNELRQTNDQILMSFIWKVSSDQKKNQMKKTLYICIIKLIELLKNFIHFFFLHFLAFYVIILSEYTENPFFH